MKFYDYMLVRQLTIMKKEKFEFRVILQPYITAKMNNSGCYGKEEYNHEELIVNKKNRIC